VRIAYLTGGYPRVSHTFVLREVDQLRMRGVEVETFSLWRTRRDQLLTDDDRAAFASTYALLPPRPLDYVRAHLSALLTRPLAYLRLPGRALRLSTPGLRGRLLALSWFVESILLWDRCRRRGIEHVHVHFAGTPAAVAALTAEFGGPGSRGPAWSWSISVHGSAEFLDPRLGAKAASASFVVCASDFARSQVMALLDEARWGDVHVVRCALDVDQFRPREPRKRFRGDPFRLLHVGRLIPQKGQAILLEAVAALLARQVPVHLTFVGAGPKRSELERLCEQLEIADHVTWEGALGQDAVRERYAAADAFCMSSFVEGVPVVLMEAMASELPVVATRIAGIPELVEDGVSGMLVAPGRPDELAGALERLAENPALCRELGERGRRRVEERSDLSLVGAQLHELLRRHVEPPAEDRRLEAAPRVEAEPIRG
jgi:colanic acid/amylovoran biosynthesis glycosyltransferase